MSFDATFETVERLVLRIIAGEAVFFVGAGFSLDSEPNTSARLIRRLLARFAAITEQLSKEKGSQASQLQEGLRVTFDLGSERLSAEAMVSKKTVNQLKLVYYNINDWICSAFTILLSELASKGAILEAIRERERQLLGLGEDGNPYDEAPLEDFNIGELLALGRDAGKGLFLETMGFANREIWGGDPREKNPNAALASYGSRLRDRQCVIARLAREGLAPLILTTNFDLLLEGACRGAGFEVGDAEQTDPAKPAAAYDRVLVIGGATDFFERGNAYRAALLLKIHGCVHRYREERERRTLSRYLPSMVFTYREIQNWRNDSWSRDMVSTLLRTRSIVLCGYSGADPVVHDTFRTVYEEILSHRSDQRGDEFPARKARATEDARAFFTGGADKGEFAGLEILRAGSRAAGVVNPPLFGHPNYLPFHFNVKAGEQQRFPTLDELFLWIYHRTLRGLQLNAIRSDLNRMAVMLLQRNVAPADIEEIAGLFEEQCREENERAREWDDTDDSRREFSELTAWTRCFHVALLREFALMETVARNQRSGLRIQDFRSRKSYFALLDRPGWGAWGAVTELALRRMCDAADGRRPGVAASIYPTALMTPRPGEFTRTAVILRGPGGHRITRADLPGLYRQVHEWHLMAWMSGEPIPRGTPTPDDIWGWSFLPAAELGTQPSLAWFGESDDRKSESVPETNQGTEESPVRAEAPTAPASRI